MIAGARQGDEHDQLRAIVERLTRELRQVEAAWSALEHGLKAALKGAAAEPGAAAAAAPVETCKAHAHYDEETFLPLSQLTLGRDSRHMAALGTSLHLRRAVPELLDKRGFRG